jgi:predicted nucleotidyltransferase
MDQISEIIKKKTDTALASISNLTGMERAFLFGSQVDGTADQWSDIDMAIFVEGAEGWDIHKRARLIARIQKEAGDDIDVHFIPAKALRKNDQSDFAVWVLTHGVEISL